MILVMDIGNTNMVFGVYDESQLRYHWRLQTVRERTEDEMWIQLKSLFNDVQLDPAAIVGVAISSVVPPLMPAIERMVAKHFQVTPVIVGPHTHTDLPIDYESPRDVGADRIVNAVAAIREYGAPLIVIDFGTATTFCVINDEGRYLGGLIVPGIQIATEALFHRAAKLPRIELTKPSSVIGRNTVTAMQAGVIFGYTGLLEGIVERIRKELPSPFKVVATGGLAQLVGGDSPVVDFIDPDLTLKGLRILWEMNTGREQRS